ncbi:pyridoxamine 5'-phosphate oxidase [Nitzschia inconspicua]|uniref:Pyridoxamine 5'-phosphate oxidase n=1 Tax=Nitzschia inconspicua TaxID=303405 RepID=A0A9K3M0E0_9STRA|nr:pyridoxamine 5'-phosphate oxidase [Nitzschia inconspicua]
MANHSSTLATILGTTLVVGTLSSLGWYVYFTLQDGKDSQKKKKRTLSLRSTKSSSTNDECSMEQQKYKPPFPKKIRNMLSNCRLAYLSTVDAEFSSSHLSLMRFTYWQHPEDGEVVIMSTNRNTKKYEFLKNQKGVALLVHDFGSGHDGQGMYSITLNGECRILPNGSNKAEEYRQRHLEHNPEYPQFIVGDDIDILCVDVTSARICDIQDQVVQWNVQDVTTDVTTGTTPQNKHKNVVVVSKDLVQIPYIDLQTLFGNDAAISIGSIAASNTEEISSLFANRLQYDALRKTFTSQQKKDLLHSLMDNLQDAFGPNGLGFLEVTQIPSEMVQLRSTLLPMAEQLANLPSQELKRLERPDDGWTIGWSHGKEHFKDGSYDMAKGSFYVNPFFGGNHNKNPNVYPPSLQPHLEERMMKMTRFMGQVGLWVGTLCDLYLQREATGTVDDDPWMITSSLVTGSAAKARLLYYFPKEVAIQDMQSHTELKEENMVFDDWCGQHKDHGSITALLPGMLFDSNNHTTTKHTIGASSNTPYPPGLYIETRQGELVNASLASTSLGFQLGETLQIMSRGKFRATPHSVKAPTMGPKSSCGRASLAVFLQPMPNQVLPPLTESGMADDDDGYELQHRWRNTFGEFQEATTNQFN